MRHRPQPALRTATAALRLAGPDLLGEETTTPRPRPSHRGSLEVPCVALEGDSRSRHWFFEHDWAARREAAIVMGRTGADPEGWALAYRPAAPAETTVHPDGYVATVWRFDPTLAAADDRGPRR